MAISNQEFTDICWKAAEQKPKGENGNKKGQVGKLQASGGGLSEWPVCPGNFVKLSIKLF